jgi:hypothetical protein
MIFRLLVAAVVLLTAGVRAECPVHIGTDETPYRFAELEKNISKWENCASWNNPGCLQYAKQEGAELGPKGYAVFTKLELGKKALHKWWEGHRCFRLETALRLYNPHNPNYASVVLQGTTLDLDSALDLSCVFVQ